MHKSNAGLGAALLGAAALGGCADLRRSVAPPPVNTESPVAAQVRAAAPLTYVAPRLIDVPPAPRNVPEAPAVKAGVVSLVRCRRGVAGFALAHPPLSAGTEQFASDARDVAQANTLTAAPPDSAVRSEAAASDLRAYAAPPSAIASGPAPTPADASPDPPPAAAPRPTSGRAAAHSAASPAAAEPSAPLAAPAPAPNRAVAAATAVPGFPAPVPDPLLARCP